MTHIIFNFPDDLGTIKKLIDVYENADSKAVDTSEPETIITPLVQEAQEEDGQITLDGCLPDYDVSGMEEILKNHGLHINKITTSRNVIACDKTLKASYRELGDKWFSVLLDIIQGAFPDGKGERWNRMIIADITAFLVGCRKHGIIPDIPHLIKRLSKSTTSSTVRSVADFRAEIDANHKGMATLIRYNCKPPKSTGYIDYSILK